MLLLLLVACGKMNVEPVVDPVDYDGDFAFSQELTVPLGTRIVYIEYNDNTRTLEVPVSPELVKPDNGKNVEPFGVITLNLVSPVKTVFNPNVNSYWNEPKTEQYSVDLEQLYDLYGYATLAEIQASGYYNVVPGYVNVSGGLYTYTVIYHIKDRAGLDAAARDEIKQNMINTVYQTTNQNFYVVTTEGVPVGLKGYTPYDIAAYQTAADAYSLASETDNVDPNVYYKSTKDEGYIWAFKCPTLTRHMWNKLPLSMAYPNYSLWLESNGANSQDWYTKDVDPRFLSCWW